MSQKLKQAVILGSGRGVRRLDPGKSSPGALQQAGLGRTVLDWALHAFVARNIHPVVYVGGYHIEKVIEHYPDLAYHFHTAWQEEGELAALLTVKCPSGCDLVISRSTTIFLPEALDQLFKLQGDIIVGVYSSDGNVKPVGLVVAAGDKAKQAFAVAQEISQGDREANLEKWIETLHARGWQTPVVNLDSLAAPVSDQVALARTVFKSKAEALEHIHPLLKSAVVLDQVRFTVEEWQHNPSVVCARVMHSFKNALVVVRSSAHAEDGLETSLAGRFRTVLNVSASDPERLAQAINQVANSYVADGRVAHARDMVFVQAQVSQLAASGVLLTRDLETGASYYVLNIDRYSGRSDVVTSGAQAAFDTVYVSRHAALNSLAPDVRACIILARELESLMHLDALDIEFGIGLSGQMYLFQVRPLAFRARHVHPADVDLELELEQVRQFLAERMRPHAYLFGRTTLFGTMPDWNPAEMIGTAPRPLAFSLYQRLIGNHAWAAARAQIGYQDVRPEPLIVALGGRPHVDVRASLNSFLPADLNPKIACKWVDYGLECLRKHPRFHDKIEFEIAITCRAFDFDVHLPRLREAGLQSVEIDQLRRSLLALTDGVVRGECAPITRQLEALKVMEIHREAVRRNMTDTPAGLTWACLVLLANCERYGTIPFSIVARYAFIAMTIMRSLWAAGVFSKDEYELVLRSIPTVASEMGRDLARHAAGKLSTQDFLATYGHLRPSSYDITSPNYASAPDMYLGQRAAPGESYVLPDPQNAITIFNMHRAQIERLLRDCGYAATCDHLCNFILHSIPAREWAKFKFMENVNAILEIIAQLGKPLGFTRDDMSFLPIDLIARNGTDSATGAVRNEWQRSIEFCKKRWNLTVALRLPDLITSPSDIYVFQLAEWTPNFVSSKRVVASSVILDGAANPVSLEGRVVLIRGADPGFDWIFGHPIAGLVTQYGGVASHMAIRAAEFGLPAAIGCGEIIFESLRRARLVELDCINKKIRGLA